MGIEEIRRVAIGTAQFGMSYGISNTNGKTGRSEVARILSLAARNNIDTIDTAYAYGNSEHVLGGNSLRGFKVVTKFLKPDNSNSLKNLLDLSLDRLNVNSIYAYLAHNAAVLLDNQGLWEECLLLKQSKRTEKIGFSVYTPKELDKLFDRNYIPDVIQLPYSIIDRRFEPYFNELERMKVEIHTRSCFLQGLLLLSQSQLPTYFEPLFPFLEWFDTAYPDLYQKTSFLLNFCLHNRNVNRIIIGVNNERQLIENIKSIKENMDYNFSITGNLNIPENILLPYKWPKK